MKPAPKEDEDEVHVETEVPVHVAKVTRATLHRYVDGFGTVAAEPAHDGKPAASARLASPVGGVLVQALCFEGQRVEKGATLFQLDPRAAAAEEQKAIAAKTSASATFERVDAVLKYEEREIQRTKTLREQGLASEKDLHDAELRLDTARNELAEARAKVVEAEKSVGAASTGRSLLAIKSPIAGTVVRIFVNPGEGVDTNPATVIADVIDLDRLAVTATLPARELPFLKIGEAAELFVTEPQATSKGSGDEPNESAPVRGTLAFLGFEVDTKTDTIPVRISFPTDAGLRPGQYLRLRIAVEEHKDCLAVPVESVVTSEGASVIAVVQGEKATQKNVKVGVRENALVEVVGEGLEEGASVVTAGAYGLPKETKVRVIGE